jgi:chromate transporter
VKIEGGPPPACSPGGMARYFLRLGATGFGGPVALANAMRRDLVDARRWLSEREYDAGLTIAAACPGPLAFQLAVYCGYVRFGVSGGLLVAAAFALAPFLLVLAAAAAYTRFEATETLRGLFYGVAPVVVALIVKASLQLGRKTLRSDRLGWGLAALAAATTAALQRELTILFLGAGVLGALFHGRPRSPASPALAVALPLAAVTGSPVAQLFLFFFRTGALVFGSGLVIVPFLKTYVVDEYHWISTRAFLDSVAVGLISPGPVVITATFVGYLVAGVPGAAAATLGIFAPAVVFTIVVTPIVLRHGENATLQGFVRGVTAAVVGVLLGTSWLVARSAIGDPLTLALAAVALAALVSGRARKVPEPVLILAGAVVGLIAYPLLRPDWLP